MSFERIKTAIEAKLKKLWSVAPSAASVDLLALYNSNPRLDGVRIIATKCASTELFLYNREDYRKNKNNAEIIEDSDIYELLDDPCPNFRDLTGWSVKYFVIACYALVGEAYLLKIRDPKGKVISLSPMSPSWVVKTPTAGDNYYEIYPYGTMGGNSIVVPPEDIIVFKDINLLDPFGRGKGTAEAIGDEIQSDEYASKYAKNLFFNDATPSAIIYAPKGNKDSADQIKQTWLQKMAGFRHAKEPMVLTGEGSKFEKVSQSPQELDFVESRKFLRDTSNQRFHIPPEIMGILDNSNRSTIDASFYLLGKNVLPDYLRMYERALNTQLLWEDFDPERTMIFHHENTIEEDVEQKLRIANEGLSRGVLTVNDWRRALGYEIDEKGGDVYLRSMATVEIPFNSQPVELPDVEEKPEAIVEIGEDAETTSPDNENQDNNTADNEGGEKELSETEYNRLKKEYEAKHTFVKSKERYEAIWKAFDVRARSVEEPFIKSFEKAWKKQNELVDKTISEAVDNNKDVGTAIENLYNRQMDENLKHAMAGAFFEGLEKGAEHGAELIGKKSIKAISDALRRVFNMWVDTKGLELCTDMNDTTKKKLRQVLSESIEAGEDLNKRKKALIAAADEMFQNDMKYRAELIARTESCTTINAGSYALYQTENVQRKVWIATLDDRTRDAHLLMDGVVVPMNEKFEVPATSQSEGALMDHPADATAPVGQVANCRCSFSPFYEV